MPYPNEHSARLKSPGTKHIRVRRTKGSGKGTVQGVKIPASISVIWYIVEKDGEEVPVAQALRFPTKTWTAKEARDWLKDKKIKYIKFEKASEEKGKEGKKMNLKFKSGLSYEEASSQINAQLRDRLDISADSADEWVYVREFYLTPHEGIAEHFTKAGGANVLYRFAYELVSDDEIKIVGVLEEVEETFVPVGKSTVRLDRDGKVVAPSPSEKPKGKADDDDDDDEQYECACLDCGKTVTSDEHCRDIACPDCGGEMRRKERPGAGSKSFAESIQDLEVIMKTLPEKYEPVLDKDARRVSTLRDGAGELQAKARLGGKAKAKDPGWVQGYAAVWDNVDLGGEIMRKGAFHKTIEERVAAGKVKLMAKHFAYGGDVLECVGTITEAKEDEIGLWYNAKFASTTLAQSIRTLILEGHVDTCSVGYMPVRWNWLAVDESGGKVLEHLECKFFEVTVTVIPMNELAKLTAAKSLDLTASKIQDIVEKLDTERDEVPEEGKDPGAAKLVDVFGSEAEAKAFLESLEALSGAMGRLLNSKSEPEDTVPDADDAPDETADLRRIELGIEKRRLEAERLAD